LLDERPFSEEDEEATLDDKAICGTCGFCGCLKVERNANRRNSTRHWSYWSEETASTERGDRSKDEAMGRVTRNAEAENETCDNLPLPALHDNIMMLRVFAPNAMRTPIPCSGSDPTLKREIRYSGGV
jgi:hypothetical protein